MAKVTIVGNAAVITSALGLDDIRVIGKYRPDSLVLREGEDGSEPVFAIGAAKESSGGSGSINSVGATFGGAGHDERGSATITMMLPTLPEGTDAKEWFIDSYGASLTKLNRLEAKLPAVLDEINEERAEVAGSITIA